MTATTFIKQVKESSHDGQFYYVTVRTYQVDGDNENYIGEEIKSIILTSEDDAIEEAKKIASDLHPDADEMFGVNACQLEIDPCSIDMNEDEADEEDWTEFLMEYAHDHQAEEEVLYYEDVLHTYPSIQGDIVVVWGWEKYIGYARNFIEIREGEANEDESLYLPIDKTFVPQCSQLISAHEREGLNEEDLKDLISERINSSHWKWTPRSTNLINMAVNDAAKF